MQIVNIDQDRAWNGPEGRHWAERADGLNADLTTHLITAAAIRPGDLVLDVGCGTGASSRAAARQAVDGEVVGLDLSEPMLTRAREHAERDGLTNVRFIRGDAQVHPLPTADVAISQFGIMFFTDPVAAFANIGQALRPGGRLAFVCPRSADLCDWYRVPIGALTAAAGISTARPTPNEGMFTLADPGEIRRILTTAGYTGIHPEPVTASITFGRDVSEAVAFFAGSGPVLALQESGTLTAAGIRTVLTTALQPYAGAGGVQIPGRHWIVQARWAGTAGMAPASTRF